MFFKPLWPALTGALVIMILSLMPGRDLPEVPVANFDKAVHAVMYAGLTILFARGFFRQTRYDLLKKHCVIGAFLVTTVYGGFLELVQSLPFVGRSGDWLDFLFDAVGALAASALPVKKIDLIGRGTQR